MATLIRPHSIFRVDEYMVIYHSSSLDECTAGGQELARQGSS